VNIRKAVLRGTSLTRQLLAFTESAVQPQMIDLNAHLKDVTKLIRPPWATTSDCDPAALPVRNRGNRSGQLDQIC
jgi:hypothetical protein